MAVLLRVGRSFNRLLQKQFLYADARLKKILRKNSAPDRHLDEDEKDARRTYPWRDQEPRLG
jgi:hypothetical protein